MKNTVYSPIQKILEVALAALLVSSLVSPAAVADRLHFSDGESITGSLVGIDEGRLTWLSTILGELKIELHHVEWIESGERFDLKTTGREYSNCWMYVQREQQLLHCDQGVQPLSDWKMVVVAGETLLEPPPLLTHKGNLRIAAEDATGNSNINKYNVDGRAELRYSESRHTLALLYQEEEADGASTRNMWRSGYQYDQFFTEQWFTTGVAFYEEDEFRELDRRTSVGLGMGYQFLDNAYFSLLGKGTLNYVDERFTNGVARSAPAVLWNLDFGWRFNEEGMELFHRHALLQATDETKDWEVSTVTGFKYPINGHFSSIIQLEFDYDNLPAEEAVDKKDQKWSIGLNYDW
jgi:putative salt-induced outer membrane protein YdiY